MAAFPSLRLPTASRWMSTSRRIAPADRRWFTRNSEPRGLSQQCLLHWQELGFIGNCDCHRRYNPHDGEWLVRISKFTCSMILKPHPSSSTMTVEARQPSKERHCDPRSGISQIRRGTHGQNTLEKMGTLS